MSVQNRVVSVSHNTGKQEKKRVSLIQLRIECFATVAKIYFRVKVPNPKIIMHDNVIRPDHLKRIYDINYHLPGL